MSKDKLVFTTVEEVSAAVAVRVPNLPTTVEKDAHGNWIVVIDEYASEPFTITDPHHWMMIVEALRGEEWEFNLSWDSGEHGEPFVTFSKLHRKGLTVSMETHQSQSHPCTEFCTPDPGIAISLAALRAHGIDCEWVPE